jgi:pyruvate/2-oxoglutarate dehydrogenase complex dihydrolipoamide acyltransferase (E2) component
MSITYDHRVIDGMLGGKSLKTAVDYLESLNENTIQF